jgi:hypothetical protein
MQRVGETTRITLELERGSEPIAGQLASPGGPERRFSGYMELIAALDALRTVARAAAAPRSP